MHYAESFLPLKFLTGNGGLQQHAGQQTHPLHADVGIGAQARLADYGKLAVLPVHALWVLEQAVRHLGRRCAA